MAEKTRQGHRSSGGTAKEIPPGEPSMNYEPGDIERFRELVGRNTPHECWEWGGRVDKNGYGFLQRQIDGKRIMAHRLAWEAIYGPIPPGLQIHHICNAPLCMNPDHLSVLSPRGHSTLHHRAKRKTHCSRGHAFEGENLLIYPRNGKVQRMCRICMAMRSRASWRNCPIKLRPQKFPPTPHFPLDCNES